VPLEERAGITALNGRLYLSTGTGLLELDPESGEVQVLVSSRRRPAAQELDELWDASARLFARSDGHLGLHVTNHLFDFDPAGRMWSGVEALPGPIPYTRSLFFSGEGVFWLLGSGHHQVRQLLVYWSGKPTSELLLEKRHPLAFIKDPSTDQREASRAGTGRIPSRCISRSTSRKGSSSG